MTITRDELLQPEHPLPTHRLLHITDTHLLNEGELLYGSIDCAKNVERIFEDLRGSSIRPDGVIFTGDLTNDGQREGYQQLRKIAEPACAELGAEIFWIMGNHDSRPEFRSELLDGDASQEPVDYVADLNGLRIVGLDSTVPGYHYGDVTEEQYEWLTEVLSAPAEHGTILAMHHPPIPSPLDLLASVELKQQNRLIDALQDSDVRSVLSGHVHYSTTSILPGGIPVSVAAATCYTQDLRAPSGNLHGQAGGQGFNLVDIYTDRVVHTVVPLDRHPVATHSTAESMQELFTELAPAR